MGTVKVVTTQKFAFLSSQVTLKSGNRMGENVRGWMRSRGNNYIESHTGRGKGTGGMKVGGREVNINMGRTCVRVEGGQKGWVPKDVTVGSCKMGKLGSSMTDRVEAIAQGVAMIQFRMGAAREEVVAKAVDGFKAETGSKTRG